MSAKFDVLLYGATGFTGKLTAAYLDGHPALAGRRWAIAGRSLARLEEVAGTLGSAPAVVACELTDAEAVARMVRGARVVISCAGPYSLYDGERLLGACAAAGVHYSDLAGESFWQREMAEKHHAAAAASGAKIVLGGGVDSIPSDLGAMMALAALGGAMDGAGAGAVAPTVAVQAVYTRYSGYVSGGTLASGRAMRKAAKAGRYMGKHDPYILAPGLLKEGEGADAGPAATRSGMPRGWRRGCSARHGALFDFFMAPINAAVVRRSLALRGAAARVSYSEVWSLGALLRIVWCLVFPFCFGYLNCQPLTWRPKPGQGPPQWLLRRGGFSVEVTARASTGEVARAIVSGRGDPGYGATSKMLAETALCLAFDDTSGAPSAAGVLTPASALGDALVARLDSSDFMSLRATGPGAGDVSGKKVHSG